MSIRLIAFVLAGLAMVAGSARAAQVTLVRDGKAVASIVVPATTEYDVYLKAKVDGLERELRARNPKADEKTFARIKRRALTLLQTQIKRVGDEEKLAATELQEIIEKISGAKLPIMTADGLKIPEGPTIVIGAALARQRGLGPQIDKLDRDGLICTVRGGSLILTGKRARGTLYAVYTLLESLGCRWVMPKPFGEIYPSMKTIETGIDTTQNPSHSQRYWWCTYGCADGYARWTLRNKGNYVTALGDSRVQQGHALSGALRWGATQPKYQVMAKRTVRTRKKDDKGKWTMVTEEKVVPTLPDEYYALVRGKPSMGIPNMSNPKVWDLYADYYTNWFKEHPDEEYASMSCEDGLVLDERPASRSLESNDFDFAMGAFSATDKLWFFLNRVIERVVKVYPNKKFGVLVYSNNMMPPRIVGVHPNMALVFAPLGISPLHDVRDPKSKTNREYCKWLEDWMLLARASGAETYYYDYEPMGYCWNMAMICPRWAIIGKNYPWFHKLGLNGHTSQGYDDWGACGLDNYLMERLYWNADQDYHDIIADYARTRFGAAAPAMIEYYGILEKRMSEIPDLYSNEMWANHLILTPEVRAECRKALQKAVALADTERAKAQVGTMVDVQRSTDAMCDGIEYARETGDFAGAARKMEPVFEIAAKLQKLYPNFMNAKRLDKSAKTLFLTGGLYNQYKHFGDEIAQAGARLALPRYWRGMLDTRNHAAALGYQRPGADVSKLDTLDITVCPDVKYQTQREVAAYFYRAEVDVPADFKGKKVTLVFPGLIAKALQIWVNGKPVEFDLKDYKSTIWRGPDYFWYDYNHERKFDLTGYIEPGKKNTIAFRVFKSFDFGGSYRRAYLLGN